MDALVAALTAWISIQTGLSAIEPPRIEFVSRAQMSAIAFGPRVDRSTYLQGLYNRPTKTVYLRDNWNIESLRDRSELVHELVHHFQNSHDLQYPCNNAREGLAYDLQLTWLREQRVKDPYELLGTNELFIVLFSTCRDADAG